MRFPAKTLALLRQTAESTMTSTLKLVSITRSADGSGGYTEVPATGDETACRIAALSMHEQVTAGQIDSRQRFRVFAPHDFTAGLGDRLEIDSVAYEIEQDLTARSGDVIETAWIAALPMGGVDEAEGGDED